MDLYSAFQQLNEVHARLTKEANEIAEKHLKWFDDYCAEAIKAINEEKAAKKQKRTKGSSKLQKKKKAAEKLPVEEIPAEAVPSLAFNNTDSKQTLSPGRESSIHLRLSSDDDDENTAPNNSKRKSSAKFKKPLPKQLSKTEEPPVLRRSTRNSKQEVKSEPPKRSLRSRSNTTAKIEDQSCIQHSVKKKAKLDTFCEVEIVETHESETVKPSDKPNAQTLPETVVSSTEKMNEDGAVEKDCVSHLNSTDKAELESCVPSSLSNRKESQVHLGLPTPQRFENDTKPKKSFKVMIPQSSVSPKSPRQLFSPYSTPGVKDRAKTFEAIIQSAGKGASYKKDAKLNLKPVVEVENIHPKSFPKPRKSRELKRLSITKTTFPKQFLKARRSSRLRKSDAKNEIAVEVCPSPQKKEVVNDDDEWEDCEVQVKMTPSIKSGSILKHLKKKAVFSHGGTSEQRRSSNTSKFKVFSGSSEKQLTPNRFVFSNGLPNAKSLNANSIGKTVSSSSRFGTPNERMIKSVYKEGSAKKNIAFLEEEAKKREEKEKAVLLKRDQLLKQQVEARKLKNEQKRQMVMEKREQQLKEQQERQRSVEQKLAQSVEKKQSTEKKIDDKQERMKKYREKMLQQKEKQKEKSKLEAVKPNEIVPQVNKENISIISNASSYLSCKEGPVPVENHQSSNDVSTASSAAPSKPKANLNVTFSASTSTNEVSTSNYDITPHYTELPPLKLKNPENYDIADIKSDDDTDDESAPRKKIPAWAQGYLLRKAIVKQLANPSAPDEIFSKITTCELQNIFTIKRKRFVVRTSSAVWLTPPFKC